MEYELYLRREAFHFLRSLKAAERERLWTVLADLGENPVRAGDFYRSRSKWT
jgi:hypothetical protein